MANDDRREKSKTLLGDHRDQRAAFLAIEAQIRAEPLSSPRTRNIDGHKAAEQILAAVPRFMTLRERLERLASISELDMWLIDHCVEAAHAYAYAEAGTRLRHSGNAEQMRAYYEEGVALVRKMRPIMEFAQKEGFTRGRLLRPLPPCTNYRDLQKNLTGLARYYRKEWDVLQQRIPVITEAQVERAEILSARLLEGLQGRKDPAEIDKENRRLARKAFALMIRAYAEVRRAVLFLEPKRAEEFAPTLYKAKGKRRKQQKLEKVAEGPSGPVPTGAVQATGATEPALAPQGPIGVRPLGAVASLE